MNNKNNLDKVFTCRICGKKMRPFFAGSSKTLLIKNGVKRVFVVCSEACKNTYESRFFVEEYKGNKIYCIDGKYVPYFDCNYYFETLEDCKKRIDLRSLAIM